MPNKCSSVVFLLFHIIVCVVLGMFPNTTHADELDLLEIVKKHDDMWKGITSIQLSYTRHYKTSIVSWTFPNCYWESAGSRVRAIVGDFGNFSTDKNDKPVFTERCEDFFQDGTKRYTLKVPQNKYPLLEIQLCDYKNLQHGEEYSASIISTDDSYVHLNFPIPRYFFVHTDENVKMTLLELVSKYPSKIASFKKNAFGDDIVEIAVESLTDGQHKHFGRWTMKVLINMSKGYHIEDQRFFTTTKEKPSIEIIMEKFVKRYTLFGGHWIPSDIENVVHNGEPAKGAGAEIVVEDCQINSTSKSRLDDFRFPTNCIVREQLSGNKPQQTHIWGSENKPARTFDDALKFLEYFADECPPGEGLQPLESKYIAFRIAMVVLGVVMIIVALYRLYAKDR